VRTFNFAKGATLHSYAQARNQLGTPWGGGEEFSDSGANFSNYVQYIFPGQAKIFLGGDSPPWLRAWIRH